MGKETQGRVNRAELRRLLMEYFNESDLQNLSFDLNIDYEAFPGRGKGDMVRELIASVNRLGRMDKLVEAIQRERPNIILLLDRQQSPDKGEKSYTPKIFNNQKRLFLYTMFTVLLVVGIIIIVILRSLLFSPRTPTILDFRLFANMSWQPTGLQITKDDMVKITYIGGMWKLSGDGEFIDPLGSQQGNNIVSDKNCYFAMSPHLSGNGALIAKIGDNDRKSFNPFKETEQGEGMLYLRANDCDVYTYDNTGSVIVHIEVIHE